MSGDPLDLTGLWDGTFRYPGDGPDTPFLCRITDNGGRLTGIITEPDMFYRSAGTLSAELAGVRRDRSVDFVKTYRGQRVGYEKPVDYVGQVSSDGLVITGSWSLSRWDGSFEMFRDPPYAEEEQVEEATKVPLDR